MLKIDDTTNPLKIVQNFFSELEKIIVLLDQGETSKIIQRWEKISSTIGKKVSVKTNDGIITGLAKKINSDGSLNIVKNGKVQRLLVGDISI